MVFPTDTTETENFIILDRPKRPLLVTAIMALAVILWMGIGTTASSTIYRGNVKSKKFHEPSCRYYNCKKCTAIFRTRADAIKAGYVPCKVCKP